MNLLGVSSGVSLFMTNLGLWLGLGSVFIGQCAVVAYYYTYQRIYKRHKLSYDFTQAIIDHFSQLEGFILLASYLTISWYFQALPPSYYVYEGSVVWLDVALQLIVQDAGQYVMHRIEHKCKSLYRIGHRYHHKHIHPLWFNSFEGSFVDTVTMVILPLIVTSRICSHVNVWSYMAFGTIYSGMLVLIHSEFNHPWEDGFRLLGIGTATDHHMHHRFFTCNYGHIFMWWDYLGGTHYVQQRKIEKLKN